jgi:hypothetical protein
VDNPTAKRILASYRSGVDDADPQFAEALAQARRDPELSRWLEQEVALDAALREKLRSGPAPVGLKTRILANVPAQVPVAAWWRRRPVWLVAVAAILIVEFVIYWPNLRPANAFVTYRSGMVQYVASGYDLQVRADNFDALRQRFVKDGWPADYVLPERLTQVGVRGGCLSEWRGKKVSMLCLRAHNHNAWLLVIDRHDIWNAPHSQPVFAKEGTIATASWTAGHLTYVLATEGDDDELKSYL